MKPNKYATLALAGLISLYGCDKGEDIKKTEEHKPTVSRLATQEPTNQELLTLYTKLVATKSEFQKKIDSTLIDFARGKGYKGVEDIVEQDYQKITSSILQEMNEHSDFKAFANLYWFDQSRLRALVNEKIDESRTRNEEGNLYVKGQGPISTYSDRELVLRSKIFNWWDPLPSVVIQNPTMYTTITGKEAVHDRRYNVWVSMDDLSKKPGPYAKGVLSRDLDALKELHNGLLNFMLVTKPNMTPEALRELLDKNDRQIRDHIYLSTYVYGALGYTGEGGFGSQYVTLPSRELTFRNLLLSEREIMQAISNLRKLLAEK